MTGTPLAGTDLSREILGEVLDERGKSGSNPQEPATTLAEQMMRLTRARHCMNFAGTFT